MQKTFTPAVSEVAELIREAMGQGHTVLLSLPGVTPHVDPMPPLAATCRLQFGLTRAEGLAFAKLVENEHVTKSELHEAMMSDGDPAQSKTVGVVVHKLRKKLTSHGIEIITVWGSGFMLDKATRARLREILAGAPDAGLVATPPQAKAEAP